MFKAVLLVILEFSTVSTANLALVLSYELISDFEQLLSLMFESVIVKFPLLKYIKYCVLVESVMFTLSKTDFSLL